MRYARAAVSAIRPNSVAHIANGMYAILNLAAISADYIALLDDVFGSHICSQITDEPAEVVDSTTSM